MLALDLGGVELALAAFGAEYRELRRDLVQGARDLVVALAQCRGRLDGVGQLRGHGLGRRGGQLLGQLGDPARSGFGRRRVGVARSRPVRRRRRLPAVRPAGQRPPSSSARCVTSLSCKRVACVDISVSLLIASAATRAVGFAVGARL